MIQLSVNLNKVATLRNSRGHHEPRVTTAAEVALDAGAPGVTVHPRADERHIRPADVTDVAALMRRRSSASDPAELNIEGDPRPELMDLVVDVRPAQCTLVPVTPGEITSQAGWPSDTPHAELSRVVNRLRDAACRNHQRIYSHG